MGESIINQRQAVDTKTKAGIINKKERRKGAKEGEKGEERGEREEWVREENGKEKGGEGEDQLAAKARSMRERSSGVYMVW